jgi:tetratricopeptide (TPR) repeat protein
MKNALRPDLPTTARALGQTLTICLSLIGFVLLLTLGCNSPANEKEAEQAAILHNAPYAPLTDSLKQAGDSNAAGLYFRRAELLSHNNLHELAVKDYRRSWELRPDEMTGFRYASTLSIIGQTNKAAELLRTCENKYPQNSTFPSMLAELYQQTGKSKDALAIYDALLHRDSLDNEAWYEKGLLLEKLHDTVSAIDALARAYRMQPVNTYALELAHLYAEHRNPVALSICDDVLRKDSSHELLDPLFIKGIYYSNTAQYKKAITQFDSCIRRDWKFTDAYLEKGIAQYEQKKYDTALSTFQMTIKVSDTYPDGYFWAGRCYEARGSKDQALLYYRQALALDKDFTEAADRIKRLQ